MVTKTKTNQPQPANSPAIPLTEGNGSAALVENDSLPAGMGTRDPFARYELIKGSRGSRKSQLLSEAGQLLARSADLFGEGADKAEEATEVANSAALILYQARRDDLIEQEQLTELLGNQFGFKMKGAGNGNVMVKAGDKNASATPFGPGELVRKRVVRLAAAHAYAQSGDASAARFFEGLPQDDVAAVVNSMEGGTYGIYRAFDRLTEIKKAANDGNTSTPAAFDVKKLAAIAADWTDEGAAQRIADSEPLLDAIVEMNKAIRVLFEAAMEIVEARDEAETETEQPEGETETE